MKLLTFLLTGPLQSWGDSARWDARSTAGMPGKSAIIGLLGCCLGYPRGDERLKALSEALHVAVRADRSGCPVWDFQTVQRPQGKILNSEGKPRGETIITPKQYLQNAAFQVFIYGDVDVLEKCMNAMLSPYWVPFLGRRNCPPALPIVPRIVEYATAEEALESYYDPQLAKRDQYMTCQSESMPTVNARALIRMDEVIRADLNVYDQREVYEFTVVRRCKACT